MNRKNLLYPVLATALSLVILTSLALEAKNILMTKFANTGTTANLDHPEQTQHSTPNQPATPLDIQNVVRSKSALAKIHLGDTYEQVTGILGNEYTELQDGLSGARMLEYKNAFIHINPQTNAVTKVYLTGPAFSDELGVKVGDSYDQVVKKYKLKYPEYKGLQGSNSKNFFEVEPGIIIILDSERNDGTGPVATGKIITITLSPAYKK